MFDTEVVTHEGNPMRVRSGTYDIEMTREIWADRYYTEGGWDVVPGSTVLDIGGCVGAFAVFAAWCGAAAVHTFEPMPDSFALLTENVARFPNVIAENAAVAIESGEVLMSGFGEMGDGVVNTGTPAISSVGVVVPAVSIHEVLTREPSWDVVKLDIEGYEYPLIEALSADELAAIAMFTMEFHHPNAAEAKARGEQLGTYLAAHGFDDVEVSWAYGDQGRLRARRMG